MCIFVAWLLGLNELASPRRTVLVDFPSTAKFLTPEERAYVIWRKSMSLA